ncbi:hypothetical protein F5I97DRAFT_701708 [Phlebopus sp. FC_14]|nr:hypothetical protein F5I97DRAFT_701708 [Phlebopus sp. FC_14]
MSTSTADACIICFEPLSILSDDEEGPVFITDDVELRCGHHSHWTCLMDWARTPDIDRTSCPQHNPECGQSTLDSTGRFIVNVTNEGGFTNGFDFGEVLDEEDFLEKNPEQQINRAFHDLIAQGEYEAASQLIEQGADVNCTYGKEGLTAMQKAMLVGDTRGVEFLQSKGAAA